MRINAEINIVIGFAIKIPSNTKYASEISNRLIKTARASDGYPSL